jgi:hypothetical protein
LETWIVLRIMLAVLLAVVVQSGNPERRALQSRFVSSDVEATWSFGAGSARHDALRLLVLWRGTPGWAMRAGSFGAQSRSVSRFEFSQNILVGPHIVTVAVDSRMPHALIDGREVDLRGSNVALVDRVDETSPPRALDAIWVEPEVPPDAAVETIIRREPRLRAFLRCDRVAQTDVVGGMLCRQTLGP